MPLISSFLYTRSLRKSNDLPFMQGEAPSSGWSVPWRPIVLLGTHTFANSFVRHFLVNDLKGAVLIGVMIAASVTIALLARRRERLGLLARDVPYSQVETELSIANSTLKTHVRHIYAKLGVTDKRELVELVGSRR